MIRDPNLIHFTCIAKGTTILAEFNTKDANLTETATKCLSITPQNHSFFTHTIRSNTYTFLIDQPFVYFAITDEKLENFETLAFLNSVKDAFCEVCKGEKRLEKLSSHCYQGEFNPVFHQLLGPVLDHVDAFKSPVGQRVIQSGPVSIRERTTKNRSIGLSREFPIVVEKNGGFYSNELVGNQRVKSVWKKQFLGVSCTFFALKLLPEPEMCDERWLEIRSRLLKGSAHLLSLLVWRTQRANGSNGVSEVLQKLENAKKEIDELKKIRREDVKANQKVVSIIAAREQSWFNERKKLREQIGGLMNDLRALKMEKVKPLLDLNVKLKELEAITLLKDKTVEESERKRREMEEDLEKAENLVVVLTENGKDEAQRHASEILKHKTAFIELVSNQRQLEAEMGRALRQVEAAKQEIDSVLDQKKQFVLMNQRLSMEIVKLRNESAQKDQILSATLRKSKLDTTEKQMLLKEVKSSKAKRKKAELWKIVSESNHEKRSLRNMLSKHVNRARAMMSLDADDLRSSNNRNDFEQLEIRNGQEVSSLISDPYLSDGTEAEEPYDIGEKFKIVTERRHKLEIDAFAEQLRVKDEKFEAFQWRLVSMELESKRMESHMEGLEHEITQLRQDNLKLEALLSEREAELHSLKEELVMQFKPPNLQKLNFNPSLQQDTVWSKVRFIKRKSGQTKQETNISQNKIGENEQLNDIVLTLHSPNEEIKEKKVIVSDEVSNAAASMSIINKKVKSTWKMDIHALGVSYKIKRIKQQLLNLERLMQNQETCDKSGEKGLNALVTLLNKQADRYESLQVKTDDLCKRMHEGNLNLNCGEPLSAINN